MDLPVNFHGRNNECQVDGFQYGRFDSDLIIPEVVTDGSGNYTVTRIDHFAFYNTGYQIVTLTLPATITEIGDGILQAVQSCKAIHIPEENMYYTTVDGVLYTKDLRTILQYPAAKSTAAAFTVPAHVRIIGAGAYANTNFTSVTIPEGVEEVNSSAFSNLERLESIELPASMTKIGNRAVTLSYATTSRTYDVYYYADEPVTGPEEAFMSWLYDNATLHVKESALGKIKKTAPWYNFAKIEPIVDTGIDDIGTDAGNDLPPEIFTLDGIRETPELRDLPAGIYIIRQGGKSKKILIGR